MGNGRGDVRIKRALEMDAFDSLPKPVRQALSKSVGNYSAYTLKEAASRFDMTARDMVEMIELQDSRLMSGGSRR